MLHFQKWMILRKSNEIREKTEILGALSRSDQYFPLLDRISEIESMIQKDSPGKFSS